MSFFSGLLSHAGCPRNIYLAWRKRTFDLVTCEEQICEIREVSRRKKFAEDIDPNDIGVLINSMRRARFIEHLPRHHKANDPTDSYLLNLAVAGSAHFLITGDKASGILDRKRIGNCRILTPIEFCKSVLKL